MNRVRSIRRRSFLRQALAAGSSLAILPSDHLLGESGANARRRAAIIGHTGRGNYGHELDVVFNQRPGIEVVAVADPDAAGRRRAAERSGALRPYADYREMLEKEHPQLVVVAPRHTDQHHDMVAAALKAGAHVLVEKPFAPSLADADDLIALAGQTRRRIAVAHQMRLSPAIGHLKKLIDDGWMGSLVSMAAHGKQDARSGGEDLLVLGTHLFDLMRLFAGDVSWCSAQVFHQGREATRSDIRPATENIGPVLGDEIEAQYSFTRGVTATFTSRARLRTHLGPWGLTLVGEKASVRILADVDPGIHRLTPGGDGQGDGAGESIPGDPSLHAPPSERGFMAANRRVVDDWLDAIAADREAACSGAAGMKAVEMALGVFAAGLAGGRVKFPLNDRRHPLS